MFCHGLLTEFLSGMDGVEVIPHYLGISTAFKATAGSGKPVIAVCAEYDALPGIGHACGHNLISETALAAFIGAKRALDAGAPGTVILFGTPAEEGGGGKVCMIDRGAFADVDMAMMAHPSPSDCLYPPFLCSTKVIVSYHGRNAHAAAAPWEGVNALDAVLQAFSNISMMRQQMKPSWRVHGVITNGGVKANVIPDLTETEWIIRAPDVAEMEELRGRVTGCFDAAATSTGCTVEIEWNKVEAVLPEGHISQPYTNVETNSAIAEAWRANMAALGTTYHPRQVEATMATGSTDMGNVSHVVPSIHPMFGKHCAAILILLRADPMRAHSMWVHRRDRDAVREPPPFVH